MIADIEAAKSTIQEANKSIAALRKELDKLKSDLEKSEVRLSAFCRFFDFLTTVVTT